MPVIEQAKGIVMARARCRSEEAFELLRRVSQRANLKVHVPAGRLVEQVSAALGERPRPASPVDRS
jgi:AmiR/NasT family two-component response regulator